MALGEDLPVGIWVARAPGGEEVYANRTFAQILGTGLVEAQVGGYSVPYGIYQRGAAVPRGPDAVRPGAAREGGRGRR